ncbi:MAG: hypothetical protein ACM3PY_17075 [Omnitrophica WOR_2 bacterium]
MDFGEVLSRAWQIIWKHKVLWIFGILAGCGGAANSGGSNSGIRYGREATNLPPAVQNFFIQIENLPRWELTALVLTLIAVILVFVILAILLGTIGRIGLIRGTQMADQGAEVLHFSELFHESSHYFWRVFGLNLVVGLILFAIALVGFVAAILAIIATLGLFILCALPLLCVLIPLAWLIQVIVEQANIALVVEDLGILAALERGWRVFIDNLGAMIVMALILIIGVGGIGGLIIGIPVAVIIVPALTGAFIGTQTALNSGLLIAGLCLVAYIPVLWVLSGILRSYTSSAWTLTYLRLTRAARLPSVPTPPSTEPMAPVA